MRISDWSSDVCSSDLLALDDVDQRETVREAAARRRGADLAEQRILALYKKGWVTRAARDQTVADAAAARAAERAALARLEQHVILAGIDGLVVKRDVEPGDLADRKSPRLNSRH